jgi:hypothetical protein
LGSVKNRTFLRSTFGGPREQSRAKIAKLFASCLEPPRSASQVATDPGTIQQILYFVHPKCRAFVSLVLRMKSSDPRPFDGVCDILPFSYFEVNLSYLLCVKLPLLTDAALVACVKLLKGLISLFSVSAVLPFKAVRSLREILSLSSMFLLPDLLCNFLCCFYTCLMLIAFSNMSAHTRVHVKQLESLAREVFNVVHHVLVNSNEVHHFHILCFSLVLRALPIPGVSVRSDSVS